MLASQVTTMEHQEQETPQPIAETKQATPELSPAVAQQILALQAKLLILKELL